MFCDQVTSHWYNSFLAKLAGVCWRRCFMHSRLLAGLLVFASLGAHATITMTFTPSATLGTFTVNSTNSGEYYQLYDAVNGVKVGNPIDSQNGSGLHTKLITGKTPGQTYGYVAINYCRQSMTSGPVFCDSTSNSFTVGTPPPAVVLNASFNVSSINEGEVATFTWSTSYAKACSATGISGVSGTGNTISVPTPAPISGNTTITATITCTGDGALAQKTVVLNVVDQPRTLSLSTANSSNGSYTVSWKYGSNGYFILQEQNIGTSAIRQILNYTSTANRPSGSVAVNVPANGVYEYTVVECNPISGAVSCQPPISPVRVTVTLPAPSLNATISPSTISEGGAATLTWSSSNTTNCSSSALGSVSGTANATGVTYYAPTVMNADQTVTIPVTCIGGGGQLTVNPSVLVKWVNDSPTITGISNMVIDEDTSSSTVGFAVNDEETAASSLKIDVGSSNPSLIPITNVSIGGTGTNHTVAVTPLANANGSATITLTVKDDNGGQASSSFVVTVNAVNDTPTISGIPNVNINEGTNTTAASTGTVNFTVADVELAAGNLNVSATSSNEALIASNSISFVNNGTNRSLTAPVVIGQTGSTLIKVTVGDGQVTSSSSFTVTVNDLPAVFTNVPTSSSDGNYSVTWDYAKQNVKIFERFNNGTWDDRGEYVRAGSLGRNQTQSGTYDYQIKDCYHDVNQGGTLVCSAVTDTKTTVVTFPAPAAPPLDTTTQNSPDGSVSLNWGAIATGVDNYYVYENGGTTAIWQGRASGTSLNGRATGAYSYIVKACNSQGCTASSPKLVNVANPSGLTFGVNLNPKTGVATVGGSAVGANSFEIQQSTNGGATWTTVATPNSLPVDLPTVNQAGGYRYQARACATINTYKNCTGYTTLSYTSTLSTPVTPTGLSVATNSPSNTFPISWSAIDNAIDYRLEETPGSTTVQTQTSTSLTRANGSYSYRVAACNVTGCSGWSGNAAINVAAIGSQGAVTASMNPSTGIANLSWAPVSGATSYKIQPKLNGAPNGTLQNATTNSATLAAVSAAGTYTYTVTPCATAGSYTNCGNTVESNSVAIAIPASVPVVTLATTSTANNYPVAWGAVTNAVNYIVTDDGIDQAATPSLSYSATNKANGTHHIQVRACNAVGCTSPSADKAIDVAVIGTQGAVTASMNPSTGVANLSWAPVSGATSYKIQPKLNGVANGSEQTVNNNSATLAAVSVAGNYSYTVKACATANSFTNCSTSVDSNSVSIAIPVSVPVVTLASTSTTNSYSASWSAITNAVNYIVTDDSIDQPATPTLSYSASNKSNATHHIQVRACNAVGCTAASTDKAIDVAVIGTQGAVTASMNPSTGIANLSWAPVSGAASYKIQPKLNGVANGVEQTVNTNSATLAAVSVAGNYSYTVKACATVNSFTNCSNSVDSNSVSIAVPSSSPVVSVASTSTLNNYPVTWTAVTNAVNYVVTDDGVDQVAITALTYSATNKANGTHHIQVKACNAVGCTAASTDKAIDVAVIGTQGAVTASMNPSTGVANLSWAPVSGATSYKIQPKLNGAPNGTLQNATTTSVTLAAVSTAGTYTYAVTPCATAGSFTNCSLPIDSNTVSLSLPSVPVLTLPTSITTGNFTLTWASIPSAAMYYVNENGVDKSFPSNINTYSPSVQPNGTYRYTVKACNVVGCSLPSAVSSVDVVRVGAISSLTASLDQMTGLVTLNWPSASDATKYQIQVRLNGNNLNSPINLQATNAATMTTVLDPMVDPGTYTYAITACAEVGISVNCTAPIISNSVSPEVPPAPMLQAPLFDPNGVYTVSWSSVVGAFTYELFENNLSIQKTSSREKLFDALNAKPTGTYLYQVRACKVVCGPLSNLVTTIVKIPANGSSSSSSTSSASQSSFAGGTEVSTFDPATLPVAIDPINDVMSEGEYNGALSGSQSVGPDGSFNYSLPISIPVGVNGVQPNISLTYNSNRRNGLVGWGWSLSGLSTISRCTASLVKDGYVNGIGAADAYKFCLDGQRLVETAPGEYHTESESFAKIQKSGNAWVVISKDGSQRRFGYDASSREEDDQQQTFVWHMDKFTDVSGNSWSVTYAKDSAAGTFYPSRIDYTATALLSAQQSVVFGYESRADIGIKFSAGIRSKLDKRLVSIQTFSSGKAVKTYTLSYQQDGQVYRGKLYSDPAKTSRLAKITLCYTTGVRCADPVEFDWSVQSQDNYVMSASGISLGEDTWNIRKDSVVRLDINGDGIEETYSIPDESVSRVHPITGATYNISPVLRKADINHDGFDDVIKEYKEVNGIEVYLSNGTSINTIPAPGYSIASSQLTYTAVLTAGVYVIGSDHADYNPNPQTLSYTVDYADVTGDGLLDVIRSPMNCFGGNFWCKITGGQSDISVAVNNGHGFDPFVVWYNNWNGPNPTCLGGDVTAKGCEMTVYKLSFVDMNSDGLADFLATTFFPDSYQASIVGYNNGKGTNGGAFTVSYLGGIRVPNNLVGDFNGDGISDIVGREVSNTTTDTLFLGVGSAKDLGGPLKGYQTTTTNLSTSPVSKYKGSKVVGENYGRAVFDFNGDGLDDIIEWGGKQQMDYTRYANYWTEYSAYVYLSQGGNDSGGVNFSSPILIKDLALLNSVGAQFVGELQTRNAKVGVADYNLDGAIEDDSRLKNNVKASKIEAVIESARTVNTQYMPLVSDKIYRSLADSVDGPVADTIISAPKISGKRVGVKTLSVSNGAGGVNTISYTYKGSKIHGAGYGDLGFATVEKIETVAGETPIKTVTDYYQTVSDSYNVAGSPKRQRVYVSNAAGDSLQMLSDTRYQMKVRIYKDDIDAGRFSPHYFAYLYESSSQSWDLDGTKVADSLSRNHASTTPSCTPLAEGFVPILETQSGDTGSDTDYHADGVLLYSETATCDTSGSSAAVHIEAKENLDVSTQGNAKGLIGKRKQYSWSGANIGSASKALYSVRTMGATYNAKGQLFTQTVEPDLPTPNAYKVVSTYTYNTIGSVNSLTETWDNLPNGGLSATSRVTSMSETFASNGERTQVVTNPLGFVETTVYDSVFGVPTSHTDSNNIIVKTYYDDMGRQISTVLDDGTNAQTDYRRCNGCFSANSNAVWYSQQKNQGSSAVRTYYDGFNRAIGSRTHGLNGDFVYSTQRYNARGGVREATAAYYDGDVQQKTVQNYDALGRVSSITYPDGAQESRTYSGLLHTTVNRLNQTQKRYLNASGWVMKTLDNANTPVDFTYTAYGDLQTTKVNNDPNTLVTINYDALGRKTDMTDPNTGTQIYTYNALGLTATQMDAKQQRTCYVYDVLGRQVSRVDNASDTCTSAATHTWTYDSILKGKLTSLSGFNTDNSRYIESYKYTVYGEQVSVLKRFSRFSRLARQYYDSFHRPVATSYPGGYTAISQYNANGHLAQVSDTTNTLLWSANKADATGNVTQFTLGNGVVTDQAYNPSTGYIDSIRAAKGAVVIQDQTYHFDNLGNLAERRDNKNNLTQSFCYDGLNRLKAARFDGCSAANDDNAYDALGNLTTKEGIGTMTYGTVNTGSGTTVAGPHAVTQANGWSYQYDAIGNLTQATKAGEATKTVTYSPFNTPTSIVQGSKFSNIVYNPNQERILQTDSNGRATAYFGNYEEVTINGITEQIYYIGDFALFVQKGGIFPSNHHEYLHRDHIGSIIATSTDVLNSPSDVQWETNGPWGERRYQQWNGPADLNYVPSASARGFTDHEHLDAVGLIHMNGRVYDPELGRFLSADPHVQAPYNSQSYNRYSYVFNNPLSFTDPTGYDTEKDEHAGGCPDGEVQQDRTCVKPPEPPKEPETLIVTGCRHCDFVNDVIKDYHRGLNWVQDYAVDQGGVIGAVMYVSVGTVDGAIMQDAIEGVHAAEKGDLKGVGLAVGKEVVKPLKLASLGNKALRNEKKAEKALDKVCCFVAGTLVQTSDGEKPIESIELGQLVASKNPDTGEEAYKPVTHLFKKLRPIFELKVQTSTGEEKLIETTNDHPFFVIGKGWTQAEHLIVGDVIESNKKGNVKVVVAKQTARVTTTYNIEVANFHTYYATEFGLLVHNIECKYGVGKGESKIVSVSPENLISQQSKNEMSGSLVKKLEKDMKINGYQGEPVTAVVRGDGRLVISDGHHRTEAAVRAGLDKIPVDIFNPL